MESAVKSVGVMVATRSSHDMYDAVHIPHAVAVERQGHRKTSANVPPHHHALILVSLILRVTPSYPSLDIPPELNTKPIMSYPTRKIPPPNNRPTIRTDKTTSSLHLHALTFIRFASKFSSPVYPMKSLTSIKLLTLPSISATVG